MAKSAKQKKIDELKKGLWLAVCEQVSDATENGDDATDRWYDWDAVQEYLRNSAEDVIEVAGGGHKDYEGKLCVTPVDRKKILEEVETSCLSEKAKKSFRDLLED